MSKKLNTRAVAAKLSWQIVDKGQSLDAVIGDYFNTHEQSPQDRGLIQEMVYGVCRWYGELDHVAAGLLQKPIRNKDRVIHFVLLVGLYQLRHIDTAEHAAVAETVAACKQLQKMWAKNLINGCLRSYLREIGLNERSSANSISSPEIRDRQSHPDWIVAAITNAWPDYVAKILHANNLRPPMCLRVNARRCSRDDYLLELNAAGIEAIADPYSCDGVIPCKAVPVSNLPGFEEASVSVQDTAAQLACGILDAQIGDTVLDACAAPGGKAAHLLERANNQLELHALDISERRCEQLHGTLLRLDLDAKVFVADASAKPNWPTPDLGYDRILIDAPCSGLGVIRRHPDIKHHRRPEDIVALNEIQQKLLQQLWLLLKPGGKLLYMTCSILPSENQLQIDAFIRSHADAQALSFDHPLALELEFGKQTLPGVHNMDGFYYCLLEKKQ
jgi:16S rRNA (cytosine967-C5)-methyltransferase